MNTLIYLHIVISIISRAYMETEEIIFVINRISCVVEQFSMSTESNPGFYLFLLYFVSTVIVPPSQPIRLKTETNRVMATCVFPRFRGQLTSSSHWFLLPTIGCCDCFGFGFTTLNRTALYYLPYKHLVTASSLSFIRHRPQPIAARDV